jgi:hypothetical protein
MSNIMKSVQTAIIGMGILGVVIVLLSIILVKTKEVTGSACLNGYTYIASADNCFNSSVAGGNVSITALGTNINTAVTAIATPVTYFALIVLVIVFVFLLGFLIKKLIGAGKGGSGKDSMD